MTPADGCLPCRSIDPARTGLSRRAFLGRAAGAGLAALAGLQQTSTRVAFAEEAEYDGDVLVVLSLRGGFDGLSAIVPLGDPGYQAARPTIAVPPSVALDTGTRMWGLNPALAPLKPWWDAGTFGAVHAVGAPDPTRSHFAAVAAMEQAAPGSSVRSGWLDRALGARRPTSIFQGSSVGDSLVPRSLAGPFDELGLDSIDRFSLDGVWGETAQDRAADGARWAAALTALHAGVPALAAPARAALGAVETTRALSAAKAGPANGARYPHLVDGGPFEGSTLSAALFDVARLIRARVGLQVACVDFGDWDMHTDLGATGTGQFHRHLSELAACLAAFCTDLGPAGLADLTLVTLSEFGRRVAENGDRGTDHGHGNAMLLVGGGVRGGTVHGNWPGLADGQLADGDLRGTTDYRDVLAEVLTRRCRQPAGDLASVFPGRGAVTPVNAVADKP